MFEKPVLALTHLDRQSEKVELLAFWQFQPYFNNLQKLIESNEVQEAVSKAEAKKGDRYSLYFAVISQGGTIVWTDMVPSVVNNGLSDYYFFVDSVGGASLISKLFQKIVDEVKQGIDNAQG